MKKYERINNYNKKYTTELSEALKIIMPGLIEAFVRVFGEKHRHHITYTLTNLKFVFFIPEGYLNILLKDKVGIRQKDMAIMKYYLKYLNYLNLKSKSISEDDEENFIFKNYVTRMDLRKGLEGQILCALEDDCALATHVLEGPSLDNLEVLNVVLLPIFAIDLKTIIHELTHTLTASPIALTDEKLIYPSMFLNDETYELVNDYIASETLEEYKKMACPIPKCLRRIKFYNVYEKLDILVSDFYDLFSPLILESAITGNHNKLWKLTGEALPKYCREVKQIFKRKDDDITKEQYDLLCSYIDEMETHILGVQETDYDAFYQELESMGYRVRKLK